MHVLAGSLTSNSILFCEPRKWRPCKCTCQRASKSVEQLGGKLHESDDRRQWLLSLYLVGAACAQWKI